LPQERAQRPQLDLGLSSARPSVAAGAPLGHPSGGTYFLGCYRVVNEIGVGGMASVHLARKDGPGGFQKWVAIKRIHPHLIEEDAIVRMFLDEARVAARISHPNVATVFDLGRHEDTYWIAMEYLHGEPLREVMRKTNETGAPTPPEIACRVIADAAEGLHAAHELLGKNGEALNLIHRDVTPHNIFVTYDGTTKVVDFGIAKFSPRMSSTRAGTLKGKLAYMSPEQVRGEPIDRRTDIFALGVVLWELTTGQRLFRMDSDLDTLKRVQECAVLRPSSIVRGYPVDLERIVMKALAKNRAERFLTARELSRMLHSMLMRRGLFIASDEVATYIRSIFKTRIQQREAQLRWASEVTQTLNHDPLKAAPGADLHRATPSFHSEAKPATAQSRKPPRPAAGVPVASSPQAATAGARHPAISPAFFVPFVAPFVVRAPLPPPKSPPRIAVPSPRASREYDDADEGATRRRAGAATQGRGRFEEDVEDTVVITPLADDEVPSHPQTWIEPPLTRPQRKELANLAVLPRVPTVTVLRHVASNQGPQEIRRAPLWAALLAGTAIVVLGRAIVLAVSLVHRSSSTTAALKPSPSAASALSSTAPAAQSARPVPE
jgi:eukaryotic-like serine/threonine-protein kinase